MGLDGATNVAYTPFTAEKGLAYYRCVATNTLEGAAAKSYSAVAEIFVIGEGEEHIEVSFRLISSTFTVKHGSTARDLFQQAVDAAVWMYKGPDSSYISSITAMNWPISPTTHILVGCILSTGNILSIPSPTRRYRYFPLC